MGFQVYSGHLLSCFWVQRGGYAAISSFHFGNPDFTNSEPFLKHYWQRIPFIALQDAHGNEPWWWAGQLTGLRTLFLAAEPPLATIQWPVRCHHGQIAHLPGFGTRLGPRKSLSCWTESQSRKASMWGFSNSQHILTRRSASVQ